MAKGLGFEAALKKFNAEVAAFANTLMPQQFVAFHKKIALDALRSIVLRTPVDTGRARGNWQVTIDVPAEGVMDEVDGGGMATVSKGTGALGGLGPYRVVWLTNNVPYIGELEKGSSTQAPTGMVALTITEMRAVFAVD